MSAGSNQRPARRGAERHRRPTPPRRGAMSVRSARSCVAQLLRGVAIERRFVGRRIHDDRADATLAAREEIRPGARRHVERLAERRALSVGASRSRRPSADAASCAPGSRVDRLPRLADEPLGEHAAEPRHERRAHGKVRRVGRERRADDHVLRPGDDPRVAPDDGERLGRGARPARRDRSAPSTSRRRSPRRAPCDSPAATRAEAPRNSRALERAIRRAEANRIGRRGDQRGQRRQLVAGDDRDVVSVDDALRRAQHVDRALHERTRRPATALTPGAGPIHTAKWRTLSPASSSGSSSTVPATQPRSGGCARTTTSSFGAAVPRANVRPFERDAIRRRVAREKARRDRAARRPAHRTRLGERHRAIRRRRAARREDEQLRVGESTARAATRCAGRR